ncbi:basic proline-rich protein-like [Camarhynchus parvulus]|uniref:basic proline-rich protein-like n=1 Tax=Geospiza parvula TaxID=87175 RepID=UPI00123829E7|nr:basic proline-rich protein-like [Camarhynchus parvulus]
MAATPPEPPGGPAPRRYRPPAAGAGTAPPGADGRAATRTPPLPPGPGAPRPAEPRWAPERNRKRPVAGRGRHGGSGVSRWSLPDPAAPTPPPGGACGPARAAVPKAAGPEVRGERAAPRAGGSGPGSRLRSWPGPAGAPGLPQARHGAPVPRVPRCGRLVPVGAERPEPPPGAPAAPSPLLLPRSVRPVALRAQRCPGTGDPRPPPVSPPGASRGLTLQGPPGSSLAEAAEHFPPLCRAGGIRNSHSRQPWPAQGPRDPRAAPRELRTGPVGFPTRFEFPPWRCRGLLAGAGAGGAGSGGAGPGHAASRRRCRGRCPPSGTARVSGPRRGLMGWHQLLQPHRGFVRSRFLLARPCRPPLGTRPAARGEPAAQPRSLPAPPITTARRWLPVTSSAPLPAGKSPSPLLAHRLPQVGVAWPWCPSLRGASAGNGIPKAAVPAVPSCPGVSLPALPPLPRRTPPTPAHLPVLGKSRVSHCNPAGAGAAPGATLEEGWCQDGGSPVASLVAQALHRASVSCAPNS